MARKGTAAAIDIATKAELKAEINAQKAAQAEKMVNPYKEYPLSVCTLLRAVLCEIWELRQDVIRSGFFIGHKKDFEEFAEIYEKSVK